MAKRHTQTCPIAKFLNVFGDAWTILIIREAFYGETRFSAFHKNTGIAKNLLSDRLSMLVEEGLMRRENIGERGARFAYKLTDKGRSFFPVYVAITQWSNEHLYGDGKEPAVLVDRKTGLPLPKLHPANDAGDPLKWSDVAALPGPGANKATRVRIEKILESFSGKKQADPQR